MKILGCLRGSLLGTIRKGEKTAADGIGEFPTSPKGWASFRMRSYLNSLVFALLLSGCAAYKPLAVRPQQPFYIYAFDKPHADCVEVDHKLDTSVRKWACATK